MHVPLLSHQIQQRRRCSFDLKEQSTQNIIFLFILLILEITKNEERSMSCLISSFGTMACNQFHFLPLVFLCLFMQKASSHCTPGCKSIVKHCCYNTSSSLIVQLSVATPINSGIRYKNHNTKREGSTCQRS